MKNIVLFIRKPLLIIGFLLFSNNVLATCTSVGDLTAIGPGTITVQRDTPINSLLWSGKVMQVAANCTIDTAYLWYWAASGQTLNGNMFTSNVPGIGFKVKVVEAPGGPSSYFTNAYINTYGGGSWTRAGIQSADIYLEVYKTATTVTSGNLNGKMFWLGYTSSAPIAYDLYTINLPPINISVVACSVTTPNVTVNMDPVDTNNLTGVNTTRGDTPFTIGLNCNPNARINASLSFTQNTGTADNSVIQLTGAGSPSVATGIGIQLLYGSTPLQNNTNIVLKTSAGGLEFPAGAFTARYFQTNSVVTAGDANTTATLNLTYQ